MSTRKRAIRYKCDEDCNRCGCHGHEMIGTLQDTADIVIIKDEQGNNIYSGDISKTNALIDLLHDLDYCESTYFKTIKGLSNEQT